MSNNGFDLDDKNDALIYFQGPQLLLTESNHIYDQDSDKTIIHASEWNWETLNGLVNSWKEKNGYFPALFRVDRYDNVSLVDTHEK